MKTVCGLDIHKDSIFMCILDEQGKKSDVKDAEWIATVLLKDLVRNSFVPDGMIRQLRLYGRRINELNKDIVRCQQRIDMILQRCNIRISNHVSNINSKSYRKVVDALVKGERSPDELVKLCEKH